MSILIVNAELCNPPSEALAFRALTMFAKTKLNTNNLVEVEADYKDIYYKYLKTRGLLDFVEEIVCVNEERGLTIDHKIRRPNTILTDRIIFGNISALLGKIKAGL